MVWCTQIIVSVQLTLNLIQMAENPHLLLMYVNQLSQVRFLGLCNLQRLRFELLQGSQSFDQLQFLIPDLLDGLVELLFVGLDRADPLFSDEFKRLVKEGLFLLLINFQSLRHFVLCRHSGSLSGFRLFLL